jgi:hypothetical protein
MRNNRSAFRVGTCSPRSDQHGAADPEHCDVRRLQSPDNNTGMHRKTSAARRRRAKGALPPSCRALWSARPCRYTRIVKGDPIPPMASAMGFLGVSL